MTIVIAVLLVLILLALLSREAALAAIGCGGAIAIGLIALIGTALVGAAAYNVLGWAGKEALGQAVGFVVWLALSWYALKFIWTMASSFLKGLLGGD